MLDVDFIIFTIFWFQFILEIRGEMVSNRDQLSPSWHGDKKANILNLFIFRVASCCQVFFLNLSVTFLFYKGV